MGTSAAARARASGLLGGSWSSARVLSGRGSWGRDAPLRPAGRRRAVNTLEGRGDKETDSWAGGTAGCGARLPVGGRFCGRPGDPRPRCLGPTGRSSSVLSTGLHLRNHRLCPAAQGLAVGWAGDRYSEPGSRRGGGLGGRFPVPSPPQGREEGPGRGAGPVGAQTQESQPRAGVETQPLQAPARGGDGGGGVGGSEGDKEPPCLRGERPPSHSPIVRCVSDYAGLWCPREGEAGLSSASRVSVYLGRGSGGADADLGGGSASISARLL